MDTLLWSVRSSYARICSSYNSQADAILNTTLNVPLKGLAIGNPWMDSKRQYPAYLDYAVKTGLVEEKSDAYKAVKAVVDECNTAMSHTEKNPMTVEECKGVIRSVMKVRESEYVFLFRLSVPLGLSDVHFLGNEDNQCVSIFTTFASTIRRLHVE